MQAMRLWAAGAGEVGDEDRILSAAWRAALDRVLDQGGEEEDLLRALAEVQKTNLRDFLDNYGWRGSWFFMPNRFWRWTVDASQLISAGLIRRFFNTATLAVIFLVILFLYPIAELFGRLFLYEPWGVYSWWESFRTSRLAPWLVGLFVVLVYAASRVFRPTRVGRDLLRRYRIYMIEPRDAPKGK
jgi:hypothetical protein